MFFLYIKLNKNKGVIVRFMEKNNNKNKLVLKKSIAELSDKEKELMNSLLELESKYNSISKVLREIEKNNEETYLTEDNIFDMSITIYLTGVIKIISDYMGVDVPLFEKSMDE
jgi:seryl-tRNA synthetase